jgi:glycosyltransferase involved in cell wall biosynthesis
LKPQDGRSSSFLPRAGFPLVSVVVATYNRPETLPDCLRSILNQTYANIEVIVVNDGGIDVKEIIDSLHHERYILYTAHPKNRGIAAARNTGIEMARGKYIAYLDDDDIFYPEHVETLVGSLESGDYKVAYTDANRGHQRTLNGRPVVTRRDVPYSSEFDSDRILVQNFIPTPCILHEKSCLDDTGRFDESLPVLEDWDLWIRLSRKYPFRHVRKITCEFAWKVVGGTLTSSNRAMFRQTVEVIYAKHRDLAKGKPRVRKAQRNYLRGVKFLARMSRILGERSTPFQILQNTLTTAYNWQNRFP